MTIFIEEYIEKGYCKWDKGKIIVNSTCPASVRQELEGIDRLWMEQNNTKEHLITRGELTQIPKRLSKNL